LQLESNLYSLVGAQLKALGHTVVSANGDDMGGYQAISFTPVAAGAPRSGDQPPSAGSPEKPIEGVYHGASDHRKDGQAVGW
jgi:gamma-glutamyltranspeptidase/glutathione hydrolase